MSYFHERYDAKRPTFIVVEPAGADCLYQSAIGGQPSHASGAADSLMAGLACGTASPLAWRFLERTVDFFCTVDDAQVGPAMRVLADGAADDVPIVAGDSGAAGMAALRELCVDPGQRTRIGLDANSTVLLINTEGDTAPALYAQLTGCTGDAVRDAQKLWLRTHCRSASRSDNSE